MAISKFIRLDIFHNKKKIIYMIPYKLHLILSYNLFVQLKEKISKD